MRWSVATQLLVPLFALLLGLVAVGAWTAYTAAARAARQQIELQARDAARTLTEARFPLTETVLGQIKGLSGADFLVILADGRRLATLATPDELPAIGPVADDWRELRLGPPLELNGQTVLGSGVRLGRRGPEGAATLYLFYPEARWRDTLWAAIRPALAPGLVVGMAAIALAIALAWRLARRIRALEGRTRLIAAGDFSPMPLPGIEDELTDFGRSVNAMADQLARAQETVKLVERLRLYDLVMTGLAHQLRNGVAGARLAVQLHARACNGQAESEALRVALRQLHLLDERMRRFLGFGVSNALHREPCSLTNLIGEAVTLLTPQCRHTHTDLRWTPPTGDVTVGGDPDRLSHLLINIISNAIEAAGPGGWVDVQLNTEGGLAVIDVADSGPGPDPAIADKLFQPFVTGKRDGVGLGLAVARQVAEGHGGTVTFRRDNGRTVFRVEVPVGYVGAPLQGESAAANADPGLRPGL